MTATKNVDLIPTTPAEVAKAIAYILVAGFGVLTASLADDAVSTVELIQIGIAVVGAVPVYLLAGRWPKTIATAAAAAASALVLILAAGTGLAEVPLSGWAGVLAAGLAAIGVHLIPNGSKPGPIAVVQTVTPSQARLVQDVIDIEAATDDGTIA